MRRPMMAALLCALLATPPAGADETGPTTAALSFVAGFSDEHLAGMLMRIGGRTSEMAALAEAHGAATTAVFQSEIGKAVVKHGAAWQHNLALAWTPLLTKEELLSLMLAGAQSPHTEKYLTLRSSAGQTMQALSQELFQTALTEVVSNTALRLASE